MRPMPVFQSEAELKSHYRALRARLGGLPLPPKPVERKPPEEKPETKAELIQILQRQPNPWGTNFRQIQNLAARHYGITHEQMLGPSREAKLVHARWLAMYLIREALVHSYERIGAEFGGRDHTTVLNGIRKIEARIANDPEFAATIEKLKMIIRGADAEPIQS